MLQTDLPPYPIERESLFVLPEELNEWREHEPIKRISIWNGRREPWLVSNYALVRDAMREERLSARVDRPNFPGIRVDDPARPPGYLQNLENPRHGEIRRLMTGEFTFKRMEGLRAEVARLASELLDDFSRRSQPADLYKHFALPLPSLVICALLGVPYEKHEEFQELARQFLAHTQTPERAAAALSGLGGLLEPILESKADEPAEDMLTQLWQHVQAGEMTKDEALGLSLLMLHAGHDTTSKTLTLSTIVLSEHPEQRDELLADPELMPNAVEELLRYVSAIHIGMRRIAVEDVELGGVTVRAGEGVVIAIHSANRDAAVFEDPDRFDIHRANARHQIGFGFGIHQCLGQRLARLELSVAIPMLFERLPGLRLTRPADELEFLLGESTYCVTSLPVEWDA